MRPLIPDPRLKMGYAVGQLDFLAGQHIDAPANV
jgi:hypothetical protein